MFNNMDCSEMGCRCALSGFQEGSGWVPDGFRVNFRRVPNRFQLGCGWVLIWFQVGSYLILSGFQMGSGWVLGG